jgi:hypothetical protein
MDIDIPDIWIAYRFVDTMDKKQPYIYKPIGLGKGLKGAVYRGIQETLCTSNRLTLSIY